MKAFLMLGIVLLSAPLQAQDAPNPFGLKTGDEIRMSEGATGEDPVVGTVVAIERDAFTYESNAVLGEVTVPFATVDTLAIRRKLPRQGAMYGGAWGAFFGFAAGLITAPFVAGEMDMSGTAASAVLGGAGAVGGALAGGALGATVLPARWYLYIKQ